MIVVVNTYFDLVEQREIVVDTISYRSFYLPKKDKEGSDSLQLLVDYEKKSFFIVEEIPYECKKVMLRNC